MTIETMAQAVLEREGWPRLTDRKSDRGGLTRGGITATAWAAYKGLTQPATAFELLAISVDAAIAFYVDVYFTRPGYNQIAHPPLRELLFDFAVNSGAPKATAMLQTCLGLHADGAIGPRTLAAVAASDAMALYIQLWIARDDFLHDLALNGADVVAFLAAHPSSQLHNLKGWNHRLEGLLSGVFHE